MIIAVHNQFPWMHLHFSSTYFFHISFQCRYISSAFPYNCCHFRSTGFKFSIYWQWVTNSCSLYEEWEVRLRFWWFCPVNHFNERGGLVVYCMGETKTCEIDGWDLWRPISSVQCDRISSLLPWSASDCHHRLYQRFPEHFCLISQSEYQQLYRIAGVTVCVEYCWSVSYFPETRKLQ